MWIFFHHSFLTFPLDSSMWSIFLNAQSTFSLFNSILPGVLCNQRDNRICITFFLLLPLLLFLGSKKNGREKRQHFIRQLFSYLSSSPSTSSSSSSAVVAADITENENDGKYMNEMKSSLLYNIFWWSWSNSFIFFSLVRKNHVWKDDDALPQKDNCLAWLYTHNV